MRLALIAMAACGRFGFKPTDDAIHLPDGTRPDIVFATNVAFVTTKSITPSSLGGLAAADTICQTTADQAALPGTYIAWLSTSTTNAIDRLAGSRGWVRTDGVPFVDLPSDLAAGALWSPISLLADGTEQVFEDAIVVTGTAATGIASTPCADWTSASDQTETGLLVTVSPAWTDDIVGATSSCGALARIYCFGVGYQVPVAPGPPTNRRAFLSSAIIVGGGVVALDARCRMDAMAAGLTGSYRAFIATSTMTAISRFNTSGPRWERTDGIPLAPTAADLAVGLRVPLDVRADGSRAPRGEEVWTGAVNPSTPSATDESCLDWTTSQVNQGGNLSLADYAGPLGFSYLQNRRCDDTMHGVYCLEE